MVGFLKFLLPNGEGGGVVAILLMPTFCKFWTPLLCEENKSPFQPSRNTSCWDKAYPGGRSVPRNIILKLI